MRCANSNSLPTSSSHAKSVQKKLINKIKIKIKIYLWEKNIQKKRKKNLIHWVSISFHSYIILLLSETSHSQNREQNLPFHRLTDSLTLSLPFSLSLSLSLSLSSAIANAATVSASLTASDEHSSPAIPAATISRVFHSFAVASPPSWLHRADVEQIIKPRPMRTWLSAISFSLRLKVSPLGLQKYVFLNPNSFTLFSFESSFKCSWVVLILWCLIRLSFEYLNYVM